MSEVIMVDAIPSDYVLGSRRDPYNCPVARAIKRTGRFIDVFVGETCCCATIFAWPYRYIDIVLPPDVRKVIDDFDAGGPLQYFSFPITIPTEQTDASRSQA